jgi:sulfur-carrier protein adenylyltransferase/sulfurtransferase
VRVTAARADALLREFDMVVDATDNVAARYALSDACIVHSIPLVHAAIHKYHGQVALLCAAHTHAGPVKRACYRCLHPQVPSTALAPPCESTGVLGPLPGAVGALLAQWALRTLLYMPPATALHTIDFRTLRVFEVALAPREGCRCAAPRAALAQRVQPAQADSLHWAPQGAGVPEVAFAELLRRCVAGAQLWDVRTEPEWRAGNLAALGAQHMPDPAAALAAQKPAPRAVVVYCESGTRAAAAAQFLRANGVDACILRGGYAALR